MRFGSEREPIAMFTKTHRPVEVLGIDPELFIKKPHFAHSTAADEHCAARCLSDLLVTVKLTMIDLLPTSVPCRARPQTKVTTCIPKPVHWVGKIDLRANDGNPRIALHDCQHLRDEIPSRVSIIVK